MGRKSEKKPTAAERAYASIRNAIVEGDYPVAARLREEAIAERLALSRTPIRAALQRLAGDGLVEFTSHAGAVVKGWGAADVREIFELRANLEGMGARLAAERAADTDVEVLADLCVRMEGLRDRDTRTIAEIALLNKELHSLILEMSGNRRLAEIARNLLDLGFLMRSYNTFRPENIEASQRDHRTLLAAMRTRDGQWAEAVMRSHILAASNVFRGTGTSRN